MKVLVDIKLKKHNIEKLFKKSSLVFEINEDAGMKISLLYVEKGQSSFECILSSYDISIKELLDLQRRKSTTPNSHMRFLGNFNGKATVEFGEATFNIFEFVNLINELISKTAKP